MPSELVTPETETRGKVCYFIGHVGGKHPEFFEFGEGLGYTLEEPLLCPITGQEMGDFGHTDSNGNTGSLYCRELEEQDAFLVWEAFAGDCTPESGSRKEFLQWCLDYIDLATAQALVNSIDWYDSDFGDF
jgi:hypothetical protein